MWTKEKDDLLYQIQSQCYINRIIMYDSAIYYRSRNRWTGWPAPILGGILTIVKGVEFAELTQFAKITINIITLILIFIMTIFGTVNMLLGYSSRMQRCKDMSDDLYEFGEDIKNTRSLEYSERIPSEKYMSMVTKKMTSFQRNIHLLPRDVFVKYYPNDVKSIRHIFDIQNNPPVELEIT